MSGQQPSSSSAIPEPDKSKYPAINPSPEQQPAYGYPPASGYPPQQPPPGYPSAAPVYGGMQAPAQYWIPPTPIPGVPVKAPAAPPQPGQEIIRYEVVEPDVGCGKCDTLSMGGWISVICLALILGFIFLPLAFLSFIPCCMAECHEKAQRPVYGYPPRPPV